jgi:hypothetical protein
MISALLLLLACPKTSSTLVDWEATPRLPTPRSNVYTTNPIRPLDVGVAAVIGGKRWDAVLSGAATGVALRLVAGTGSLTVPELREAALRSGWLYPIQGAQVWLGRPGVPPPPAVQQWAADAPADASIGLVRARSPLNDVWVGLLSRPRVQLGEIPRQLPVGAPLSLPAVKDATLTWADPYGDLQEAKLDKPWTGQLDVSGEWLFEVRDKDGIAALFPVYVGLVPPELDLLVPSEVPESWQEADNRTISTVERVRGAYGLRPFGSDMLMTAAARTAAENPSSSMADLAPRLGLSPDELWRWECQAPTVEACIDAILWDVRSRPGWLTPHALYGRDVKLTNLGVQIVLLVGVQ